jgi:hypothetical protein
MTPHTIKMAVNPKHPNVATIKSELQGFIVDETDGLLFIDERCKADGDEEADWVITHIPTGFAARRYPYTDAATATHAAAIAQCFFRECKARGISLDVTDPTAITGMIKDLKLEDRENFWVAIGSVRDPAAVVGPCAIEGCDQLEEFASIGVCKKHMDDLKGVIDAAKPLGETSGS